MIGTVFGSDSENIILSTFLLRIIRDHLSREQQDPSDQISTLLKAYLMYKEAHPKSKLTNDDLKSYIWLGKMILAHQDMTQGQFKVHIHRDKDTCHILHYLNSDRLTCTQSVKELINLRLTMKKIAKELCTYRLLKS